LLVGHTDDRPFDDAVDAGELAFDLGRVHVEPSGDQAPDPPDAG
jgi:hypothetical protein